MRAESIRKRLLPGKDSGNEKPWTVCLVQPSQLPFLFIKGGLSPLPSGDLYVAHHVCRPWIAVLCWFQINSSLLEKYVAVYLLEVMCTHTCIHTHTYAYAYTYIPIQYTHIHVMHTPQMHPLCTKVPTHTFQKFSRHKMFSKHKRQVCPLYTEAWEITWLDDWRQGQFSTWTQAPSPLPPHLFSAYLITSNIGHQF